MSIRTLTALGTSLAIAIALMTAPAVAQQTNAPVATIGQEIEALKQGQRQILKQLDALQKAIKARPAGRKPRPPFKGADIKIDEAPSKGAAGAKIALIEFSDYQCPYCRRYTANTMPKVIKNYVDAGKLRYVFRDFPLERLHPAATGAAVAARCAGAQGKYWQMHDRFFANQQALKQRKWQDHATALGLDSKAFNQCMIDEKVEQAVKRDIAAGRKVGVTGTPAFYFGTISADGKTVKATEMIRGARPYGSFKQIIDRLIAKHAG